MVFKIPPALNHQTFHVHAGNSTFNSLTKQKNSKKKSLRSLPLDQNTRSSKKQQTPSKSTTLDKIIKTSSKQQIPFKSNTTHRLQIPFLCTAVPQITKSPSKMQISSTMKNESEPCST